MKSEKEIIEIEIKCDECGATETAYVDYTDYLSVLNGATATETMPYLTDRQKNMLDYGICDACAYLEDEDEDKDEDEDETFFFPMGEKDIFDEEYVKKILYGLFGEDVEIPDIAKPKWKY